MAEHHVPCSKLKKKNYYFFQIAYTCDVSRRQLRERKHVYMFVMGVTKLIKFYNYLPILWAKQNRISDKIATVQR